jgi:rhamnosyltransferase
VRSEELQNCLDDILAVLVVYRREVVASETFVSLSRSLEKLDGCLELFIYDNSPLPMVKAGAEFPRWRTHYRHDPTNPGVSRAYNEGFKLARRLGKRWLLLLDQDTLFPEDALSRYCLGMTEQPDVALFAPLLMASGRICSPCRYLAGTGFHLQAVATGVQPFEGKAVLNSGMLVSTAAFARSGGFNERIRLDFADFAFNNRLRQQYDTFSVLPLECGHGFSGADKRDMEGALQRFSLYCEGARNSIGTLSSAVSYAAIVLVRCIRLTFRFRSMRFLAAYWRHFVKGSEG